jgi:hypothetical protein
MKEYYKIRQMVYSTDREWYYPIFPLTDEGVLKMMATGVAEALGHDNNHKATWGSGIYERDENGNYNCVSANWDTSG